MFVGSDVRAAVVVDAPVGDEPVEVRERVPAAPVGCAAPDASVRFPDAPVAVARPEASEPKPAPTRA